MKRRSEESKQEEEEEEAAEIKNNKTDDRREKKRTEGKRTECPGHRNQQHRQRDRPRHQSQDEEQKQSDNNSDGKVEETMLVARSKRFFLCQESGHFKNSSSGSIMLVNPYPPSGGLPREMPMDLHHSMPHSRDGGESMKTQEKEADNQQVM